MVKFVCCLICLALANLLDVRKESSSVVALKSSNGKTENILLKIYLVIDHSLFKRWLAFENDDVNKTMDTMKFFYSHVMHGVNIKYKSIDTGPYRYNVKMVGFYVAWTKDMSPFTENENVKTSEENVISYKDALKNMEDWVAGNAEIISNFGIIIVLTTYEDKNVTAYAYTGKACTSIGLILMQSGTLQTTIYTFAHEIAHSLGAKHDGDSNKCDPNAFYIMTPILKNVEKQNVNTFSTCTETYLENYIKSLDRDEPSALDEEFASYLKVLPGQRFSPNNSCQHQFGKESYYCTIGADAYKEICLKFACFDPARNVCFNIPGSRGLDGTPCGNKSWCINKKCVYDERAPVKEKYCMYGDYRDSITLNDVKYKCNDVPNQPGLCYFDFFEKRCCRTCLNLAQEDASCKYGDGAQIILYGDKRMTCPDIEGTAGFCYIETFRKTCCKTCNDAASTNREGCIYGDELMTIAYGSARLQCEDLKLYPFLCYDGTLVTKCCLTCGKLRSSENTGCEFGDRLSSCQSYMNTYGKRMCKLSVQVGTQCCQSCSAI